MLIDPDQPNMLIDLGEGRIREMDEVGIDMQVLSLSFPGVELFDAADGIAMTKTVNNNLSEVVNRYPERFAGFAALAAQAPEDASDELKRAIKQPELKGAMI